MTAQVRSRLQAGRAASAPVTSSVLVDFGSTYTKVRAVDPASGTLQASAQHRTTVDGDVLEGLDSALAEMREKAPKMQFEEVLACSSAGGGLRLGVVGLEEALTGEAAYRAALSAGARVVCSVNGGLRESAHVDRLLAGNPDIVLLAGGTNGGNTTSLLESAAFLAGEQIDVPIVLAGNELAQPEALELLNRSGKKVFTAANVMPEIGVIDAHPVRELLRELFIQHVIGGKGLSSQHRFMRMVRMATPDAVLAGAELLAQGLVRRRQSGSVAVVDLGGATTDVHSVSPSGLPESRGYKRALLPDGCSARTVEGDLGLRWNATGITEAAGAEGLLGSEQAERLQAHATACVSDPGLLPSSRADLDADLELARAAVAVALRRHAGDLAITLTPEGAVLERRGRDLREVSTIVLTGGIFAHAPRAALERAVRGVLDQPPSERRMLPKTARFMFDRSYVLATAGLLATTDEEAAWRLVENELLADQRRGGEDSDAGRR
jgi:uncharacterized protein (TIGR01319 family)